MPEFIFDESYDKRKKRNTTRTGLTDTAVYGFPWNQSGTNDNESVRLAIRQK